VTKSEKIVEDNLETAKEMALAEAERAMKSASHLGVSGWTTFELEELVDRAGETSFTGDQLLEEISSSHKQHMKPEEGRSHSRLSHSFSYWLPRIFKHGPELMSAKGLSVENLSAMFVEFMEDTATDSITVEAINNPNYDGESQPFLEDKATPTGFNYFSLKRHDVIQKISPDEVEYFFPEGMPAAQHQALWRLRYFLDTYFLEDGYMPDALFHNSRLFEKRHDSPSLVIESSIISLIVKEEASASKGILCVADVNFMEQVDPSIRGNRDPGLADAPASSEALELALNEASRAMDCATELGVGGWGTSVLESLIDEIGEKEEISWSLALSIAEANREFHSNEDLQQQTPSSYSFSFILPRVFYGSSGLISAAGLSTDDLKNMLVEFMDDSRTDIATSWAKNKPDYDRLQHLLESERAKSNAGARVNRLNLRQDWKAIESHKGEFTYELKDNDGLLTASTVLWRLRYFLDTKFLDDAHIPSVTFFHQRTFDHFEDDITLALDSISFSFSPNVGLDSSIFCVSSVLHLFDDEDEDEIG
jgi:hypothetical protein